MSFNEVSAESLASLLFHHQSALAPDFGCDAKGVPEWNAVPANERRRLIAAARLTLLDLANDGLTPETAAKVQGDHRGEAGREWGC